MAYELLTDASRATDANGNTLSGAQWFFYTTETLTPLDVYTTSAIDVAHSNPVTADSGGKFAPIYFNSALVYRGILKTAGGSTIIDIDPINSTSFASLSTTLTNFIADLAATTSGDGAALVGFKQAGASAVDRTMLAKAREWVTVEDFGAVGDGTTDDRAAIVAALTAGAGGEVRFGPKTYKISSTLGDIPDNTHLVGASKWQTSILRAYNGGYMARMLEKTSISHMTFHGNGDNYTGGIIELPLGENNQLGEDIRLVEANDGACLYFNCTDASESYSGSRSEWNNVEAWRTDGDQGSGKFAIIHEDAAANPGGHPISFYHLETGGMCSIDFGACNNVYISNSTLFDLNFTDRSLGVHIATSRIASTEGYSIKGSGDFHGCSFGSLVTFEEDCAFHASGEFNLGYTDVSGANGQVHVNNYTINTAWAPVWSAGGTPITVGNGTTYFRSYREGRLMLITARLETGTTTTGEDGGLITLEGLPQEIVNSMAFQCMFFLTVENDDDDYYEFRGRVAGDAIEFTRDTSGPMTEMNPVSLLIAGTVLHMQGLYICG